MSNLETFESYTDQELVDLGDNIRDSQQWEREELLNLIEELAMRYDVARLTARVLKKSLNRF